MNGVLRAEVFQRVFGTPLMMHPAKAVAALTAIGGRIVQGAVVFENGPQGIDHVAFEGGRPSAGKLGDRLGRLYDRDGVVPFDVIDGVAVIPVEGTLVHKGSYIGMSSGRTSYQGLQAQVVRAANSAAIRGVVFEVDSFGGEVAGAFETSELIRRTSEAKPTLAILTDHAASAGYLLASQCRQIVMPETGMAGSIGVIQLHVDQSRALENEGLKVTILSAGRHKADFNPYQPLPEDVANAVRAELEDFRAGFARAVARGRGGRITFDQAMETEADVFAGQDSLRLGLVDAVAHPTDAFDAFLRAVNNRRA